MVDSAASGGPGAGPTDRPPLGSSQVCSAQHGGAGAACSGQAGRQAGFPTWPPADQLRLPGPSWKMWRFCFPQVFRCVVFHVQDLPGAAGPQSMACHHRPRALATALATQSGAYLGTKWTMVGSEGDSRAQVGLSGLWVRLSPARQAAVRTQVAAGQVKQGHLQTDT